MPAPSDEPTFADLLELEEIDRDIFRGWSHAGAPMRSFGGQVAAQALVAAGRTVGEPTRAFAAQLLPAPRQPDRAAGLSGRPATRRRQLHDAPRLRRAEGRDDLQPVGVVQGPGEGRWAPAADADRAPARGIARPLQGRRRGRRDPDRAQSVARLVLELRGPDPDVPLRRIAGADRRRRTSSGSSTTTSRAAGSGCAPPTGCPTIRCCTSARWPTCRT